MGFIKLRGGVSDERERSKKRNEKCSFDTTFLGGWGGGEGGL